MISELPFNVNNEEFGNMIERWCQEAEEEVYCTFDQKDQFVEYSKVDESNPFWIAFKMVCNDSDIELDLQICLGTTDS